ncbi:hypothetical protein DL96DRAFT_1732049 [Flagelloscypha sp. PMI_526]|nr:hypothetical protein DL96DRAFT_1732049 [Flagelloscypha sp. PMI_526]
MREITVSDPFLRVETTLGEGPIYDPETHSLHFLDILEGRVFHVDLTSKDYTVDNYAPEMITSINLRTNGKGLVCTTAKGFAIIDDGKLEYLSQPLTPEQLEHSRFNDGACASNGMDVPGKLYRYDPQKGEAVVVDPGPFTDSNGIGWSPDNRTLYFTDSMNHLIYAYDYHDGEITNRRVGTPDGLAVDEEGCVWTAIWGGSKLIRFTKDGSAVRPYYTFPTVYKVTAVCFGGPAYDQLYVTTAKAHAVSGDPALHDKYPDGGHLFHIDLSGQFRGLVRGRFPG